MSRNIYQTLTDSIVSAIETGAAKGDDWRMPWHKRPVAGAQPADAAASLPCNAATGAFYSGMNVVAFWSRQHRSDWPSAVWATYRQWQALGAQVRKGETGTCGIYWKQFSRQGDDGDVETRLTPLGFVVFNAAQVDGWSGDLPQPKAGALADVVEPQQRADLVIAASGAILRHEGARACYIPSVDQIRMPDRFRFTGDSQTATHGYYSTLLHELGHWTGHASRCARTFGQRFGDGAYAFEELVAELASAFLCARLGITNEPRPDHAQYIASWLKVLKGDARAIVTAASQAQKACDFLLNRLTAPAPKAADEPVPMPIAA